MGQEPEHALSSMSACISGVEEVDDAVGLTKLSRPVHGMDD